MKEKLTDCYLLYRAEDAEKNKGYIELWEKHCFARGLSCHLLIREPGTFPALLPGSFVINRTRDAGLSRFYEAAGIPVYNDSRLAHLGNDKIAAYEYVRSLGLPVLRFSDGDDPLPLPFPCVMKSADGHGGTEVFLPHSPEEALSIREEHPDRHWLCQELCDTPGRDLRVYLVGHEIVGAMLRVSDTDFRANYSLGAEAAPYTLNDEETRLVRAIAAPLSIGHCGIDFLFHHGKLIFNEIEDVVGSRMLYRCTDVDVVSLYLDRILRRS